MSSWKIRVCSFIWAAATAYLVLSLLGIVTGPKELSFNTVPVLCSGIFGCYFGPKIMKLPANKSAYLKAGTYGALAGVFCVMISIIAFALLIFVSNLYHEGTSVLSITLSDIGVVMLIVLLGTMFCGWAGAGIGVLSSVVFHFLRIHLTKQGSK